MRALAACLVVALLLHGAVLLFGGALLFTDEEVEARRTVSEVEIFSEEKPEPEEVVPEEEQQPPEEPMETPAAEPPEMAELVQQAEEEAPADSSDDIARLDALSLAALESALGGAGGDTSFGAGGSLASGGRIGGVGAPEGGGRSGSGAAGAIFDASEIDRSATAIVQPPPTYPADLRRKRIEGLVHVMFVVDQGGRVQSPRIEKASDAAFERPVLDAVRNWRFEPAVRGGEKVASRVRIPVRFSLQD